MSIVRALFLYWVVVPILPVCQPRRYRQFMVGRRIEQLAGQLADHVDHRVRLVRWPIRAQPLAAVLVGDQRWLPSFFFYS